MADVTALDAGALREPPEAGTGSNEPMGLSAPESGDGRLATDAFNQRYFDAHLPAGTSSYSCFADRRTGHVAAQSADHADVAGGSTYYIGTMPTLKFLTLRQIGLTLFRCNVRTGDIRRARRDARFWTLSIPVPLKYRKQILEMLREILHEVTKWLQQHAALFAQRQNRRGFYQEEHLRHSMLYIPCLVWSAHNLLIDASATLRNIWAETADWPLMRFRFACCYALVAELGQFTALRLKSMRSRLGDHPLYNYWYFYLQEKQSHRRLFDSDALVPRPLVSAALQWGMENGHTHLVQYFWTNITVEQAEYMGMLKWRKMCFHVTHVPLFEWLCVRLCRINTIGMARITWNQFYGSLFQSLTTNKLGTADEQAQLRTHMYKLRYLLTHCCGRMRWALLTLQQCHVLNTLFMYRNHVLMELVLEHISQKELLMTIGYFETLLSISKGEKPFEDHSAYMVVGETNRDYLYKFLRVLKSRVVAD